MKLILKNRAVILAFLTLVIFILYSYGVDEKNRNAFETLNRNVASFSDTTLSRINKAVITLPEGNILVGLKDGYASYISEQEVRGEVTILSDSIKTYMLRGIYKETSPRLDAIVPMLVSGDKYDNGSLYVVLFQDRGDAVIEKSHARLGGFDIYIDSINTLPPDGKINKEEYQVSIKYNQKGLEKELVIPIIEGHFYPDGLISR